MVNNICVSGIQFEHTSSKGKDGYEQGRYAGLYINKADDISVKNCHFSNLGWMGLVAKSTKRQVISFVERQKFQNDSGCCRLTISRNSFNDIGYNALLYKEEVNDKPVPGDVTKISNNVFNGCGTTGLFQPACIWVEGTYYTIVEFNDVSNVPNYGIRYPKAFHAYS